MPNLAKVYIAVIATVAAAILAIVSLRWSPENISYFALFFSLAMVASTLKIHLPGLKGTISINFVFILISIALFSIGQTVPVALGGAVIQSLWKPQKPTRPPQVLFNASCLTVSAATAYWASHRVLALLGSNSMAALISVGAIVYVVLNTGLVSLVISLAEERSLKEVWQQCYEWTFPYFLIGAAVAGVASAAGHGTNLGLTLLIVPAMYFVHLYYRMRILHVLLERIAKMRQDDNAGLVGASRDY